MKRLTVKNYTPFELEQNQINIYNKLASLEDIEEKLGLDLDIFIKAMMNGCFFRYGKKITYVRYIELTTAGILDLMGLIDPIDPIKENKYCFCKDDIYGILEDYGKTWALTEEELKGKDEK